MLDQFIKLTGYNRKYAIRLLSKKEDVQAVVTANGKTVVLKPEKTPSQKQAWKPVYTQETVGVLEKIRAFYNGKCGPAFEPYLSVIIRQNIDALFSRFVCTALQMISLHFLSNRWTVWNFRP
jgi:hypothetical protein